MRTRQFVNDFRLLTRDELAAITGCKRRAGQIAWLRARGWVYVENANGWPQVSAGHAELRMGGTTATTAAVPSPGPNVTALRALQDRRKAA